MKFHWKVLLWMLAGSIVGYLMQVLLDGPAWSESAWNDVRAGEVVAAVLDKDRDAEREIPIAGPEDFQRVLDDSRNGDVIHLRGLDGRLALTTLSIAPDSSLGRVVRWFDFGADLFMRLLKMLIVPIVVTSIVTGVASVGDLRNLRRLGGKTFAYYIATSLLAIVLGQVLVTVIRPGTGAQLGLAELDAETQQPDASFVEVLLRMVPENVFDAMRQNGEMLSVIFFALLLGFYIMRAESPHRERVRDLFESLFKIILAMAEGIMKLLPYGVFFLMVRVVAKTGFGVFQPLLAYMGTVSLALILHSLVTLPLVMFLVGRMSPWRWLKAMSPALMTAFSTSSSSLTLPVTLDTVERRGRVSNRVTSFTLPLGATINMDGTALYECIGVIFLAQYYAGVSGFELTLTMQATVVFMALMASIGAAGIPSAGLVMMLTILATLDLPLEGAALLLAVDRPLDMMRTTVNVWSDSCAAAVIARTEGEEGPLEAGGLPAG